WRSRSTRRKRWRPSICDSVSSCARVMPRLSSSAPRTAPRLTGCSTCGGRPRWVMANLCVGQPRAKPVSRSKSSTPRISTACARVARQMLAERIRQFEEAVEAEVRRRLAEDRGVEQISKTAVKPLVEQVDFLRASRDEIAELRRKVYPLALRLATRLTAKRRL